MSANQEDESEGDLMSPKRARLAGLLVVLLASAHCAAPAPARHPDPPGLDGGSATSGTGGTAGGGGNAGAGERDGGPDASGGAPGGGTGGAGTGGAGAGGAGGGAPDAGGLGGAGAGGYAPPPSHRAVYNLNVDWKFFKGDPAGAAQSAFDDSSWTTVSLPHTVNDVDTFDDWISSHGDLGWRGAVWYRKHVKLDAATVDRKVFIEIEGVRQAASVYVNGALAGLYEAGVTPFGFDITSLVRLGGQDNVIAVRADSDEKYVEKSSGVGFQWHTRDFNPIFSGLTRNVLLHVTDRTFLTLPLYSGLETVGTYVFPSNISIANRSADVNVEAEVKNDAAAARPLTLEVVLVDAARREVARFSSGATSVPAAGKQILKAKANVTGLRFWQPGSPYLYDVFVLLKAGAEVLDAQPVKTGFRKVEFRGGATTGGIFINDTLTYLKGYAQRATNEWAALGAAVPDWMHDYDGELIAASNANFVRWMHVAAQPVDIRTADKYGIVALQPAGDKEADVTGRQWDQRVEVMRDSMIYFRNHPSILLWEAGNNFITADHMAQMKALRVRWDPGGMRAMGCRGLSDPAAVASAEYVGTMLNRHYTDASRDRAPIVESEYSRDESPRRVWDDQSPPSFGYQVEPGGDGVGATWPYNQEQFAVISSAVRFNEYWKDRIQGPGKKMYSGAAALIWADSNQHGRQLLTENCRVSGRVDAVRIPKESYYVHRVVQSGKPDIHIVGHWSYPAGTRKTVYVVASQAAKVELFVNGASAGTQTAPATIHDPLGGDWPSGFVYAFPNVGWAAGTIRAVASDQAGAVVAQAEKATAGPVAALKLTARTGPTGLRADGADIAMVDVEAVDAQGRRVPTDEARVDFTLTGPGRFEGGWNSGKLASVHKSFVSTEAGVNRVFVRAGRTAGTLTLTATRAGLAPAALSLTSTPFTSANGVATELPPALSPALPASAP